MPDISEAFIVQYDSEVQAAYQRMSAKTRDTIRTKSGVIGASVTFQKVGKGVAGGKTRHGKVPVMNIDHTPVSCTLSDWYAGDWVDKLDELKTNINERQVIAEAAAGALARKTDELIIAAAETTSLSIGADTDGLTSAKVRTLVETFGNNDVPDDGDRYAWVGWHQWNEMLKITEFASSDYIGEDNLPWPGIQAKRWMTFLWMPHSGLTLTGGGVRNCIAYHKTALGHAIGQDVTTDVTWHGDYAAHFLNSMMSMGACLIDANGCAIIPCDDDEAYA